LTDIPAAMSPTGAHKDGSGLFGHCQWTLQIEFSRRRENVYCFFTSPKGSRKNVKVFLEEVSALLLGQALFVSAGLSKWGTLSILPNSGNYELLISLRLFIIMTQDYVRFYPYRIFLHPATSLGTCLVTTLALVIWFLINDHWSYQLGWYLGIFTKGSRKNNFTFLRANSSYSRPYPVYDNGEEDYLRHFNF
jgi:hypothetical protein